MESIPRRDFLIGAATLAGAFALSACGSNNSSSTTATTGLVNRFAPPGAARRASAPYRFGLHVNETAFAQNLHQAEVDVDRGADIVLTFAKIGDPVREDIRRLMEAGYDVALTLEYWETSDQATDPRYSLKQIAAGAHDAAAAKWYEFFKTLPRPIHLRPLHEGNGDWYPWGTVTPGNELADYAPAFQHVADQARTLSGGNVRLQFSVNRLSGQSRDIKLTDLYPGASYVDEFVLNGYNRPEFDQSRAFGDMMRNYYAQFKALDPNKPLWIGETASTEKFGNKAEWILDMFATIKTTMPVAVLTWFNEQLSPANQPVRDWPIETSAQAQAAFKAGITAA